jgi:hypothetical protein
LGYFLVPLSLIWQGLKAISASRNPLDKEQIATYWAVGFSFILIVTSMFMNIGMGTYYNFSLAAFLWTWMGIGASSAMRIAAVTCPKANLARA